MADDAGQAELQERADRVEAFGYVPSDGASLGFDPEVEPPTVEEITELQKEANKQHLMPPDGLAAEPIVSSEEEPAVEDTGAAEDGMPAESASRADWDAYAESQGEDPSQFGSKQELIDFFKS
jgi:hypothetical protein